MENQELIENSFIIDLSNARDNLQIINELCNLLEMTDSKNKNICLKLRDVELSKSQLLGIKALIDATGANLALIDVNAERTILSANDLGIKVSTINSDLKIEENQLNAELNSEDNSENTIEDNTDIGSEINSEADTELEVTEEHSLNNDTSSEDEHEDSMPSKVEIPEFMVEYQEHKEEPESIISEIPPSYELYPEQNVVDSSDVSYEVFKTEDMNDEKNNELPTLYLRQTLRSGQTLSYDGNILVIGDTHPGSELIAKGDITVWGVLAGIAHAGTSGDKNAKIRALKLNAIQLRIAGIYAARKNTENIPYIQRSSEFTPQEASIENDVLVIKNINNYDL